MSKADGKWDKDAFPKQKYEEDPDREPQWWHKKTKWAKEFRTYSKQDLLDYANKHYNPYLPSRQEDHVWGAMDELWRRYGIAFGD
ncbi:hypothetical protein OAQ23_04070 [Hellea sp.]|nr:hypothetical protein [Hellea sp.]